MMEYSEGVWSSASVYFHLSCRGLRLLGVLAGCLPPTLSVHRAVVSPICHVLLLGWGLHLGLWLVDDRIAGTVQFLNTRNMKAIMHLTIAKKWTIAKHLQWATAMYIQFVFHGTWLSVQAKDRQRGDSKYLYLTLGKNHFLGHRPLRDNNKWISVILHLIKKSTCTSNALQINLPRKSALEFSSFLMHYTV